MPDWWTDSWQVRGTHSNYRHVSRAISEAQKKNRSEGLVTRSTDTARDWRHTGKPVTSQQVTVKSADFVKCMCFLFLSLLFFPFYEIHSIHLSAVISRTWKGHHYSRMHVRQMQCDATTGRKQDELFWVILFYRCNLYVRSFNQNITTMYL